MLPDESEQIELIESLLLQLSDSEEYQSIKRLVECIPKFFLDYMTKFRFANFAVPQYLMPLYSRASVELEKSDIDILILIKYLLNNDHGNWVHYYVDVFICPPVGFPAPQINDDTKYRILVLIICGCVIDTFRDQSVNIDQLIKQEKLLHNPNTYGLSCVNEAEFHSDFFIFDNLAYM